MTQLRPRSIPVLVIALCVFAPAAVLAVSNARWENLDTSVCDLGREIMALAGCGQRKVERAADRGCSATSIASECAGEMEGKSYFKAILKVAKRCRKLTKTAEKKGIDVSRVRDRMERARIATRSLVLEGIDRLKDRPGFIDDDRLVRAAAKAEDQVAQARLALTGKKPYVRAFVAYRLAFDALRKVE